MTKVSQTSELPTLNESLERIKVAKSWHNGFWTGFFTGTGIATFFIMIGLNL